MPIRLNQKETKFTPATFGHRKELIMHSLVMVGSHPTKATSLNLDLDYIDLYLIHWPMGKVHFMEIWKEFEKQVKSGKLRSIGVSNFNIAQLERVIKEGEIPPAANQVREDTSH